jgi:hypothetical protein
MLPPLLLILFLFCFCFVFVAPCKWDCGVLPLPALSVAMAVILSVVVPEVETMMVPMTTTMMITKETRHGEPFNPLSVREGKSEGVVDKGGSGCCGRR